MRQEKCISVMYVFWNTSKLVPTLINLKPLLTLNLDTLCDSSITSIVNPLASWPVWTRHWYTLSTYYFWYYWYVSCIGLNLFFRAVVYAEIGPSFVSVCLSIFDTVLGTLFWITEIGINTSKRILFCWAQTSGCEPCPFLLLQGA